MLWCDFTADLQRERRMKPDDERPNRRMADMLTALKKRGGQAMR